MRAIGLAAALGLVLVLHTGATGAASAARDESIQGLSFRLQRAGEQLRQLGDEPEEAEASARAIIEQALADPRFDRLPPAERRAALTVLALDSYRQGRMDRARALYGRANALEEGDIESWYQLTLLELDQKQYPAAARALIVLAERWPEALVHIDEDYIHWIRNGLEPTAPEYVALMQALFDANWTVPARSNDVFWYYLAVARLEQGKPEAAAAPLERIAMPELLAWVRSDRRFDGLIDRDSWSFNVLQAARQQREALEEQAQLRPEDLEVRVQLSYALLSLGEHEQVLALADGIEQAVAAAPPGAPAFSDMGRLAWIRNNRAIALRRLGRLDDAVAALERAREVKEYGDTNVSQALNLGGFQCRLGRREAAQEAIAGLDHVSDYGAMVLNAVRLCVADLGQDEAGRQAALAYLREHRGDGPLVYLEALLRTGDLDAAATALDDALEVADQRGEVLSWLQDCLQPAPLAGDVAFLEQRRQLLARADVRQAIDGVGRIEHYPLYLSVDM